MFVRDGSSHELAGAEAAGLEAVLIRVGYDADMDSWRPEVETWQGPVISSLEGVLKLVAAG